MGKRPIETKAHEMIPWTVIPVSYFLKEASTRKQQKFSLAKWKRTDYAQERSLDWIDTIDRKQPNDRKISSIKMISLYLFHFARMNSFVSIKSLAAIR